MVSESGESLPFWDDEHPADETIECYSMGRLLEPELEEFEEHVLVCQNCQTRVEAEDAFTEGMRAAGRVLSQSPARARRPLVFGWRWAYGAVAVALLVLMVIGWPSLRPVAPPAIVMLEAARGAQAPTLKAGQPLILVMDLTGLPEPAGYELEVVGGSGNLILKAPGIRQNNQLRCTLPHGLPRGVYYARLYARGGDLLREFALTVYR